MVSREVRLATYRKKSPTSAAVIGRSMAVSMRMGCLRVRIWTISPECSQGNMWSRACLRVSIKVWI